jgi:hypothetical protein
MHYLQYTENNAIKQSAQSYVITVVFIVAVGWVIQDIHIDLLLPEAICKVTVIFCIQFYVCHEGIGSEVDKWSFRESNPRFSSWWNLIADYIML